MRKRSGWTYLFTILVVGAAIWMLLPKLRQWRGGGADVFDPMKAVDPLRNIRKGPSQPKSPMGRNEREEERKYILLNERRAAGEHGSMESQ